MQILSHFSGVLLLIALAAVSFILSLAETSIISINKIKLRHMVGKGVRHAADIQKLITHSDRLIVGILVGNNFTNIAFSAIVTAICVDRFGGQWGVFIATVATTFFILTVCEILPKTTAIKNPERMALFVSPFMVYYVQIVNPISRFATAVSDSFLRVLGIQLPKRQALITEEELRLMIEVGKEEGVLTDEERRMLHRIFEFGDTRLGDVMVPKEKIVAINAGSTPEQLLDTFVEQGHARLPVYKDSIDNIIGIIYARDLLYILRDKGLFVLTDLIHPALYMPPDMKINEALRKFQAEKIQIGIVIDDKGRTLGLVTLEDLTEEIVGEIEEQYTRYR
ncbi:MAG: hemolysin family protein [Deltaproteobacteria bacterium]